MFSVKRAALVGVAALAITFMGAGTALAGTNSGAVTGTTQSNHHPDTTSVSGPGTVASPGGPVWAYDNLSFTLHSLRTGPDTYAVEIDANGTFNGFANPNTGLAQVNRGTLKGWLDETVTSPVKPSRDYLPKLEPGDMSQSAITSQFFGSAATSVTGGHYHYVYRNVNGHPYVQNG
jgi:hypothetical protein